MTILIMCQGEQRRLAHLGHPKQLLIVDGETILARTLRLCHETALAHDPITFGRVPHIYVVGNDQRLNAVAVTHRAFVISLEAPGFCVLDGIEATKPAWPVMDDRRIHVLLGDVVWSRESLVSLLADPRPLVFAGTSDVSASTGEIFGMSFTDRELVADLLATAPCRVRGPRQAQRPVSYPRPQGGHLRRLLWHAMQRKQLLPELRQHTWHPSLYLPIDDWTDDVDTTADVADLPRIELAVRAERAAIASRSATSAG